MDHIQATTGRPTVPALEAILGEPFPVLDHGFVRVVDYMGDDQAIVDAARVSYGRGTRTVRENQGLINYLMRHRHTTPFEMCEIKFHVKLPIFVARQWIRHRTASVNEYSARYSILDKEFYIPAPENVAEQSKTNRQGRDAAIEREIAQRLIGLLRKESEIAYDNYEFYLNDNGSGKPRDEAHPQLARELARMSLTLNFYTQWYWKVDLHNLLHFLSLRADPHAQYEIRAYADVMLGIVQMWVPLAYAAFKDYRLDSFTLSGKMRGALKRMLAGEVVTAASSGMNAREWEEFRAALNIE